MKHAEKKTKFLKPCGRVEGSRCLETLEREDLTPTVNGHAHARARTNAQ